MDFHANGKDVKEAIEYLREKRGERERNGEHFSEEALYRFECYLALLPYVIDGYVLAYQGDNEWEQMQAELEFELPLRYKDVFRGKIDALVQSRVDGRIALKEFKTPAATGTSYYAQLPLDSQMKGYLVACQRVHGIPVTDYVYQVIKKPQQQNKHYPSETPEIYARRVGFRYMSEYNKYYERRYGSFKQEQLDDYYNELCLLADVMRLHIANAIYIPHHPKNRKGRCQFENICIHGEGPLWEEEFFTRTNYSPELGFTDDEI